MDVNLKFELNNSFVQFLWSPAEPPTQPLTPDGPYLVEVLYSLGRSASSKHPDVAALARVLQARLLQSLEDLEKSYGQQQHHWAKAVAADILRLQVLAKSLSVEVEAGRARPLVVKFARVFVYFDQALVALHDSYRHGMIDRNTFMKHRGEMAQPLRRFMIQTSKLVKLFHQKRRSLESPAETLAVESG